MTESERAERPGRDTGAGFIARVAVDITPLRESRGFRRLWLGQSVAYVAWRMLPVLTSVQVYRLTGSNLAVGLLAIVQFIPLVTLTIVGGALADSHDRRRILVASIAGVALSTGALAAVTGLGVDSTALVFVLSLAAWSSFSLGAGAVRSLRPKAGAARAAARGGRAHRSVQQPRARRRAGGRRRAHRVDRTHGHVRRSRSSGS